jgi:hypothetical protein
MMPVRGSEQCSIGFQPVPRDHCAWPLEISNDLGVAKSRRSIDAGYRLEAYATLLLRLAGSNGGLFSDDQLLDAGFHKVEARPRAHVKTATVVHYSRIEAELVEQANELDDSDDPQFTHDIHSQSGCCE